MSALDLVPIVIKHLVNVVIFALGLALPLMAVQRARSHLVDNVRAAEDARFALR